MKNGDAAERWYGALTFANIWAKTNILGIRVSMPIYNKRWEVELQAKFKAEGAAFPEGNMYSATC